MAGVSTYTDGVASIILERIADGESLKAICEDEGMPSKSTVFKWLSENDTFSDMYVRAREIQADALFDDILTIADDGRNDWMERKDAEDENMGWRENGEALQRSRLRIDARKWMAAKLRPKKYGERMQTDLDLTNSDGSLAALIMAGVDGRTRTK